MNLYAFYLAIAVVMATSAAVVGWRGRWNRTDSLAAWTTRTVILSLVIGALWPASMMIFAAYCFPATRDIIRRYLDDD